MNADPVRWWQFNATDTEDMVHVLNPDADFRGTWAEALAEAQRLANEWESQSENNLILGLELESHGLVSTCTCGAWAYTAAPVRHAAGCPATAHSKGAP